MGRRWPRWCYCMIRDARRALTPTGRLCRSMNRIEPDGTAAESPEGWIGFRAPPAPRSLPAASGDRGAARDGTELATNRLDHDLCGLRPIDRDHRLSRRAVQPRAGDRLA